MFVMQQSRGQLRIDGITGDHVHQYKEHLVATGRKPATNLNKLNLLRALIRFARKQRLIEVDPCEGITINAPTSVEKPRIAYNAEQLEMLFSSPVYSAGDRPLGGKGETAYWLPLLGLFTGARLNELGQLRVIDIVTETYFDDSDDEREAWVIRIVEDKADGLRLKNAKSQRRVPIHADLIRLGFLDYVQARQSRGERRLFPDLKPDKAEVLTGNWSKWFGRYLRKTCKITDTRITFHSLRHTFKDRARLCRIARDVHNELTGHETGDVADDYGGLDYPLYPLVEAMKAYRVPNFKLPARSNDLPPTHSPEPT